MRRKLAALLLFTAACPTPPFDYPPGAPVVERFTVDPLIVTAGDAVTVEWAVKHADSVEIDGRAVELEGTMTVTATATGVVELVALGPGGERRARAGYEVEHLVPVRVDRLEADPLLVRPGEPVVVSWQVQNASRVRLRTSEGVTLYDGDDARGGVRVRPERSMEITLTAEGFMGPAVESVFVSAEGGLPFILRFEADPTVSGGGIPTTLEWHVAGAETITLFERVGEELVQLLQRNATEQPDGTTFAPVAGRRYFVLTAANGTGTVQRETSAVVIAERRPRILEFTVTPTTAGRGQTILLSWSVRDARQVRLLVDGATFSNDLPLSGSRTLGATRTSWYELIARDDFGEESTARVGVTVRPELPAIDVFSISPSIIGRGDSVNVVVRTSNTSTVVLRMEDGTRVSMPSDTFSWTPPYSTLLSLTATSSIGTTVATRRVSVDAPPRITHFNWSANQIRRQRPFRITWESENALSAQLTAGRTRISVEPDEGSHTTLVSSGGNHDTSLTIYGEGGLSDTATISISVLGQISGSGAEVEPNDEFSLAHDMSATIADFVEGVITLGDRDNYVVRYGSSGRLRISTVPSLQPCAGVRVQLFEETAEGEALGPRVVAGAAGECPDMNAQLIPAMADLEGPVLIRIDAPMATGDSPYRLVTTVEVATCSDAIVDITETCDDGNVQSGDGCSDRCHLEAVDEIEPNDNDIDGTAMVVGTPVDGQLAPRNADWWRLEVGAADAGPLTVEIQPGPAGCDIDVELVLYDSLGFVDRASGACATLSGLRTVLPQGTYSILVASGEGRTLPRRGAYRLSVTR